MRRQKERTRLAPQLKPGRCSESAMDNGVDFMVKKQKTLQRFWKYAVESIMNIAIICVDVRAPTADVGYVPNAKYLAHIPHQTQFKPI